MPLAWSASSRSAHGSGPSKPARTDARSRSRARPARACRRERRRRHRDRGAAGCRQEPSPRRVRRDRERPRRTRPPGARTSRCARAVRGSGTAARGRRRPRAAGGCDTDLSAPRQEALLAAVEHLERDGSGEAPGERRERDAPPRRLDRRAGRLRRRPAGRLARRGRSLGVGRPRRLPCGGGDATVAGRPPRRLDRTTFPPRA